MAHKRIEFTENQKAQIYSRDRATCAFSGLSLWLLDIGIRPNWDMDWVDHIRPSASGGDASLDNGICASSTFNAKKRDNTSDNVFFVQFGNITEDYLKVFGAPPTTLVEQLGRLKNLEPADWFFNRCIANTYIAFNWRCNLEFNSIKHKRDDIYWFNAAWKRLQIYNKKRNKKNFLERGLVRESIPFGISDLLMAEKISTKEDYLEWAERIFSIYKHNYELLNLYVKNKSSHDRTNLISEAKNKEQINPELLRALSIHLDGYLT